MLQSAGPFTLEPGALNELTIGIPWARTGSGGSRGSFNKLRVADDICQKLYDNDFELLNGPDAPDITLTELDREIIITVDPSDFTIVNQGVREGMNTETYEEFEANVGDFYRFEGYLFYQLANNTVTEADLDNPDRARLIAQCDVANGVTRVINYENDVTLGEDIFVPIIKVEGQDLGIFRTLRIEDDAFAEGDPKLVNHKSYVFLVLAYGYNATMAEINLGNNVGDRKQEPFILGRRNGIRKVAVPHPNVGTVLNSVYGDEFEITAESGIGNGGNILELDAGVEAGILAGERALTYRSAQSPLTIKVYDPKRVKSVDNMEVVLTSRLKYDSKANNYKYLAGDTIESLGNYSNNTPTGNSGESFRPNPYKTQVAGRAVVVREVEELETEETKTLEIRLLNGDEGGAFAKDVFRIRTEGAVSTNLGGEIAPVDFWIPGDNSSTSECLEFKEHDLWTLSGDGLVVKGSVPVSAGGEQTVPEFGISVQLSRGFNPGYRTREKGFEENGFQDANVVYKDILQDWLVPIEYSNLPWIAANPSGELIPADQLNIYQNVLDGSWTTWLSVSANVSNLSLAPGLTASDKKNIQNLPNIDVVFTRDQSKWTRCMVVQMERPEQSVVPPIVARSQKSTLPSVGKDGNPDGSAAAYPEGTTQNSTGYGWFPGYAIDLDKGIRLNMAFTENINYDSVIGFDMLYNPNTSDTNNHYVMVSNMEYDMENADSKFQYLMDSVFEDQATTRSLTYGNTFKDVFNWTGIMKINESFRNLPLEERSDVRVKLRVDKDYESTEAGVPPTYSFSTSGYQAIAYSREKAQSDLDIIRVVPNPYYAYSEYEQSQVDKVVKITNLPSKCTISIFTMSGSLVRQFQRDVNEDIAGLGLTSQNWELTNTEGIPVASGAYIIHIDGGDLGEKVVKFFHINRPIDLDTF
jgi:hypothetical protein